MPGRAVSVRSARICARGRGGGTGLPRDRAARKGTSGRLRRPAPSWAGSRAGQECREADGDDPGGAARVLSAVSAAVSWTRGARTPMRLLIWVPLLACGLAAMCARPLADRLPPRAAAPVDPALA